MALNYLNVVESDVVRRVNKVRGGQRTSVDHSSQFREVGDISTHLSICKPDRNMQEDVNKFAVVDKNFHQNHTSLKSVAQKRIRNKSVKIAEALRFKTDREQENLFRMAAAQYAREEDEDLSLSRKRSRIDSISSVATTPPSPISPPASDPRALRSKMSMIWNNGLPNISHLAERSNNDDFFIVLSVAERVLGLCPIAWRTLDNRLYNVKIRRRDDIENTIHQFISELTNNSLRQLAQLYSSLSSSTSECGWSFKGFLQAFQRSENGNSKNVIFDDEFPGIAKLLPKDNGFFVVQPASQHHSTFVTPAGPSQSFVLRNSISLERFVTVSEVVSIASNELDCEISQAITI